MKIKDILNFEIKGAKNNQIKYIKLLVYFLITMFLLTFLSRISKSLTVPIVNTTNISAGEITNTALINGEIKGNSNINIDTVEGCTVTDIYVSIGEKINEGDELYQLDLEAVNEKVLEVKNQINKQNLIIQRAYEDYSDAEEEIDRKIADAKDSMTRALGTEEYEVLKKIYDDGVSNKDYSIKSFKRAIEDLESDNSIRLLNDKLNEYNGIISSEGKIKASSSGVVSDILVVKGQVPETPFSIIISNISDGITFLGKIPKKQGESIKPGQVAYLDASEAQFEITSCTIDKIDNNNINVKANLKDDKSSDINLGQNMYLRSIISKQRYSSCIPIRAVHSDKDKYFIFVLKEENTILGTVYKAERIDIEVLEKDGNIVAIKDNILSAKDEIIVGSNKNIFENDEVKKGE